MAHVLFDTESGNVAASVVPVNAILFFLSPIYWSLLPLTVKIVYKVIFWFSVAWSNVVLRENFSLCNHTRCRSTLLLVFLWTPKCWNHYQHFFVVSSAAGGASLLPYLLSHPPSFSFTHTYTNTQPSSHPSLFRYRPFSLLVKSYIYCFVWVHMQARTRPRKPSDYAYTIWPDHTPACTQAHVANTLARSRTHTPEPHLTRWVVENSPDFASLNSAAIHNKVCAV